MTVELMKAAGYEAYEGDRRGESFGFKELEVAGGWAVHDVWIERGFVKSLMRAPGKPGTPVMMPSLETALDAGAVFFADLVK